VTVSPLFGLMLSPRKIRNWSSKERCVLRRLYSTFAGGGPGIGLFLMRIVAGSVLVVRASSAVWSDPPIHTTIMSAFLAGCGLLLIFGLWTPIAGALVASLESLQMMSTAGDRWVTLLLGTIGCALALLGPGLWSIDVRLFGWRRVELPPRERNPIS
jgi:hypothetical protein